jgi:hypothetical protein
MKALHAVAALLAAVHLSAHAVGNHMDITLYDRSAGRELPVHWHEGRAYVVGKPGNEYQIGLRSRRGEDLLAVVSVDGVNVMSGETAHVQQSGYVLSPWNRYDVRGWRKSMGEVAAFYFTSLGDSYAGRTGRPQNVGVIGVALFRRKPAPVAYGTTPAEENQADLKRESRREKSLADAPASQSAPSAEAQRAQPAPSAPLGTGHGRREESRVKWTEFERASETPVETITIYYDSYPNLVARGVLSAPIAPRDPRPFPGFVPDPA